MATTPMEPPPSMAKKANKPPAKIQQADPIDVAAIIGRRSNPTGRRNSPHSRLKNPAIFPKARLPGRDRPDIVPRVRAGRFGIPRPV
jgi:hypothetical protein